jgi:hypothetical protein
VPTHEETTMSGRRFDLPKDGVEPESKRQHTPEDEDDVEGHRVRTGVEPESKRRNTPEDEDDVEGHSVRRPLESGGEATPGPEGRQRI